MAPKSRFWYWQGLGDSNPRPSVLETDALPTELSPCAVKLVKPMPQEIKVGILRSDPDPPPAVFASDFVSNAPQSTPIIHLDWFGKIVSGVTFPDYA